MKKGEKTKDMILSESLKLFSQNGYIGSSVRDISSAVGLRESAIYNHFSSKKAILSEIVEKFGQSTTGLNLLDDELIDMLSKPLKFMQAFSEVLLKKWSVPEEIRFFNLVLKENGTEINGTSISINSLIEDAQKVWIMIFTEMQNHKFIKKGNPEIFANEFIAPLFFIRMKFLLNEADIDLKSAIKNANEHSEFFWESVKR
ncbi:MAG: TetR/AcrR family transcriptional regulator [Ignavibacteriales bacterium]|jgi:AcrR family transcriptional regulator|nr:TetR/AcrR family transcriptional regulator [Melioribacteraceae bacterium]RJP63478.1 MAG: TetR/AcrR family transcriptional regulator [Ignavibacteriales bacterium]